MKLKIWIAVLSFLTVVNLAAVATFLIHHRSGRPGGHEFRGHRPPFMERGPHRLPRADRERFMKLFQEFRDDTQDLRKRTMEVEDQIVDLMRQERVDREALDSLLVELSTVRLEISKKAADQMIETKEFLTPEQQEMFYHAILRGRPGGGPPGRRFRP